jgi:5-amino-6-(5-phosphoribosylamino)uracil reductase
MLQSSGELDDEDLEAVYAYPAAQTWMRLNVVASLDGGTADSTGLSSGLSGPADQRVFALLRSLADVIVVGAGTARVEGYEPVLAGEVDGGLRDRHGLTPLPSIAVVSRSLHIPDVLLDAPPEAPTLVVTCASAPADRLAELRGRADVLVCGQDSVDLVAVREQLAARGLRRILLEGGPALSGAMVHAGVLDELCLTLSPLLLGGAARRLLTGAELQPPVTMRLASTLTHGDHLLLRYLGSDPATSKER